MKRTDPQPRFLGSWFHKLPINGKGHAAFRNVALIYAGNDLLSHTRVARAPSPARTCPSARPHPSASIYVLMFTCHRQKISGPVTLQAEGGRGGRPHNQSCMSISQTLAKYRYRRRLPHLQKADAALFVTFCTAARVNLPAEARDLVLEHCLREHENSRVHLSAVVVMPDHVHLLFVPRRNTDGWPFPLVDILQCLKGATAHRINKLLHRSGPVWEEESFDHVLQSDESLKEKCEYIRQNPVKASLVDRAEDYKWLR